MKNNLSMLSLKSLKRASFLTARTDVHCMRTYCVNSIVHQCVYKKCARKSIGKHVFLSRIPSIVGIQHGSSDDTVRLARHNLDWIQDLEFHFHISLLQEGAGCSLGQNIGKGLSSVVAAGKTPVYALTVQLQLLLLFDE